MADNGVDVPKNVRRFVKDLRRSLGLTQEQFAVRVGVTFSTVNRWENGRGKPSPLAMRRIEELRAEVGPLREGEGTTESGRAGQRPSSAIRAANTGKIVSKDRRT